MVTIKLKTLLVVVFMTITVVLASTDPKPLRIKELKCKNLRADISWELQSDELKKPSYSIEYSTSYAPDTWIVADHNLTSETTSTVKMAPGANYKFRIVATGENGVLLSDPSEICSNDPTIPYKNPENVKGTVTGPFELTISWTPMPEIEHNGPNFYYKINWRVDDIDNPNGVLKIEYITDWKQDKFVIKSDKYGNCLFKIFAVNKFGTSRVEPPHFKMLIGEGQPSQAPKKFKVIIDEENVDVYADSASVEFQWNPLAKEYFNGERKGYILQYWENNSSDNEKYEDFVDFIHKETKNPQYANENQTTESWSDRTIISDLKFDTSYSAQIRAINNGYIGVASKVVEFKTPIAVPDIVESFEAIPVNSSAILLKWKKPYRCNGHLTGYNIYYEDLNQTKSNELQPQIKNPYAVETTLGGLNSNTTYRIHISAENKAGEGKYNRIVQKTLEGNEDSLSKTSKTSTVSTPSTTGTSTSTNSTTLNTGSSNSTGSAPSTTGSSNSTSTAPSNTESSTRSSSTSTTIQSTNSTSSTPPIEQSPSSTSSTSSITQSSTSTNSTTSNAESSDSTDSTTSTTESSTSTEPPSIDTTTPSSSSASCYTMSIVALITFLSAIAIGTKCD